MTEPFITPPPISEAPPVSRLRFRVVKSAVKWILFALVLIFVIRSLASQFQKITWSEIHFHLADIVLSALCLLLVPPVQLLSYRTLLAGYAHTPPLRAMAVIAWVPALGKYLPGASWVGAFYMLRKFGISAAVGVSVIIAMDGMAVLSGLITGSAVVGSFLPHGEILTAIFIVAGITCLHPVVFGRLLNFVLRKTGREPLDHLPDARHYVLPVICAFSQWLLAGMALWFAARSVADVSPHDIPRFISIAGLGYTIGYLVLFAPAGVGPRDIIFQKALQSLVFPAAMSAVAVVLLRIVQTLTELSAAMVGLWLMRKIEIDLTPGSHEAMKSNHFARE